MRDQDKTKWLLLIHQIPPKPDYFRVKIWRRLQKIGAVAIKQSVYVLPDNAQAHEDLLWIVKEIDEGGGTASLSRAVFLEGLSDRQIKALFQAARNADYKKIVSETKSFIKDVEQASNLSRTAIVKTKKELSRLQKRFEEITATDFFHAPAREAADSILKECNSLLRESKSESTLTPKALEDVREHVWVTRKEIYVDRICCAWLIQRFIDRKAEFKFVQNEKYRPGPNELRFDMFEAEFTHKGNKCTFEVLADTFHLASEPVTAIAEIVHDIDLKDNKYGRPERDGIQALFSGLTITCATDKERLTRGTAILDELYAYFQRRNTMMS